MEETLLKLITKSINMRWHVLSLAPSYLSSLVMVSSFFSIVLKKKNINVQ